MNSEPTEVSSSSPDKASSDEVFSTPTVHEEEKLNSSPSATSWPKSLGLPQPVVGVHEKPQTDNAGKSAIAHLTSGFGFSFPTKSSGQSEGGDGTQSSVFESLTKGLMDSSVNAVKAVQNKARHIVSQNKRRYQEGEFDLDLTYITENIMAMGFPAGDMSSGFFGYVEGLYRNHMEEVIKFFETHHKGKYKVYNLCSERLYDASLFEGKVASLPFDDHNCPPIELIILFCRSAYKWLKEDIQNVVVVHCKAGKARTGLMISSLLLYLKFFPTAEECIEYYNQKRCIDGKGLILPSQIRYVKYFECLLTCFNGETQPARRCMLRGFRLHNCPYWIRPSITISDHNGILFSTRKHPKTKDLMPEDFWIRAPKKGIVVFALPGEPGLTELKGDFKIHFNDRQGDFYCWLNTTMMENKISLSGSDLDGFDKRKIPSPGFQVEIVMIDYDGSVPPGKQHENGTTQSDGSEINSLSSSGKTAVSSNESKSLRKEDEDDIFSDSEGEETNTRKTRQAWVNRESGKTNQMTDHTKGTQQMTVVKEPAIEGATNNTKSDVAGRLDSEGVSDIKAIAADASVFSFGDEEDFERE